MTSSAARIGVDEFASSDTMLRLLLMMSSSIVGAEQRIGEPLSALAVLTGRHRAKNTRDPVCLARSTCLYLQPTGDRMVTTVPTESQRYREYGISLIAYYYYYLTPCMRTKNYMLSMIGCVQPG